MGLTITYGLRLADASAEEARDRIGRLHRRASDLPLLELGPLIELEGADCRISQEDPHINLKFGAQTQEDHAAIHRNRDAVPSCIHLIGFEILPGEGSSRCTFGLARHAEGSQLWQWFDYCKTQYASAPEHGGITNFLRCHLAVLQLLESCQQLQMLEMASDPSGYREKRDLEALVQSVNEANCFTAAAIGGVIDGLRPLGYSADAAILQRADFERLEAEGLFSAPEQS